jgi:stage V sporulation protein S
LGAVNQAVKACAIAAGYAAPTGKVLTYRLAFEDIEIDNEQKTAIKIIALVG